MVMGGMGFIPGRLLMDVDDPASLMIGGWDKHDEVEQRDDDGGCRWMGGTNIHDSEVTAEEDYAPCFSAPMRSPTPTTNSIA